MHAFLVDDGQSPVGVIAGAVAAAALLVIVLSVAVKMFARCVYMAIKCNAIRLALVSTVRVYAFERVFVCIDGCVSEYVCSSELNMHTVNINVA